VTSQPPDQPKFSASQRIVGLSISMSIHYHHTERTPKHELGIKIIAKKWP